MNSATMYFIQGERRKRNNPHSLLVTGQAEIVGISKKLFTEGYFHGLIWGNRLHLLAEGLLYDIEGCWDLALTTMSEEMVQFMQASQRITYTFEKREQGIWLGQWRQPSISEYGLAWCTVTPVDMRMVSRENIAQLLASS